MKPYSRVRLWVVARTHVQMRPWLAQLAEAQRKHALPPPGQKHRRKWDSSCVVKKSKRGQWYGLCVAGLRIRTCKLQWFQFENWTFGNACMHVSEVWWTTPEGHAMLPARVLPSHCASTRDSLLCHLLTIWIMQDVSRFRVLGRP